ILNLDRDQYTGKEFTRVQIKGGVIRDFVAVHRDARQILDEWLKARQDDSPALFMTRTGRKLSRREAYGIVCRVAAQANAHLSEDEKIDVSPHVLRHYLPFLTMSGNAQTFADMLGNSRSRQSSLGLRTRHGFPR